jgi:hypothetical protein
MRKVVQFFHLAPEINTASGKPSGENRDSLGDATVSMVIQANTNTTTLNFIKQATT